MMMKTDEYGQVHNSPETYADIARQLQFGNTLIIEWVDERMSRFILLFYLGTYPTNPAPRYLYVGLERKGFFGFPIDSYLHPGYVAEKLNLAGGSAEPLADLLNGVLDQFVPNRGTPVKETR